MKSDLTIAFETLIVICIRIGIEIIESYYNFVVVQPLVNIKYIIHNVEHISGNFLSFHCFNSSHVWERIWGWISPLGICRFLKKIFPTTYDETLLFFHICEYSLWSGQRITIFGCLEAFFVLFWKCCPDWNTKTSKLLVFVKALSILQVIWTKQMKVDYVANLNFSLTIFREPINFGTWNIVTIRLINFSLGIL